MKEKKTLKKLSNFIVYEYVEDDIYYAGIGTVNGDWSIEYRGDSAMYLSLHLLLDTEAALLEFCTMAFMTTYTLHGADVYKSISDAVVRELESVGKPGVTAEEDEKMLDEAVEMEELKERLKEDGDGTLQD